MNNKRIAVAFTLDKPDFHNLQAMREVGFTRIMTNHRNIDHDLFDFARQNNLRVWIEVGCFVGEDLWKKYPGSRPIVKGKPAAKLGPLEDKWYAGVIPLPEVIEDRLILIQQLLKEYATEIEALYLDFCRFPGRWEDGKNQAIFGDNTENDLIHRQLIITNFVQNVQKICHRWNTSLGIFLTPYDNSAYGQDIAVLRDLCQFLTPMLYHKICREPVSWIGKKIQEYAIPTKPILPIIQSVSAPEIIAPLEFYESLKQTTHEGSIGCIIFNWEAMNTEMHGKIVEYLSEN